MSFIRLMQAEGKHIDVSVETINFSSLSTENFNSIIHQILHPDFDFRIITAPQLKQIVERLIPHLPKLLSPESAPHKFILRINERLLCDRSSRQVSGNDGVQLLEFIIELYAAFVVNQCESEVLYQLIDEMIKRLTGSITSELNFHTRESAKIIIDLSKALDKASSVVPAKFDVIKDALSGCVIRACCHSVSHLQCLSGSRVDSIKSIIDLNLDSILGIVCKGVEDIHALHKLGHREYILVNLEEILRKICIFPSQPKRFLTIHESTQLKVLLHPLEKPLDALISSHTEQAPAPRQDTGFIYNGF